MRLRSLVSPFALCALVVVSCKQGPAPVEPGKTLPVAPSVARVAPKACTPWIEAKPKDEPQPPGPDEYVPPEQRRRTPAKKGDVCETADSNLERATKAILNGVGGAPAAHVAWNKTQRPLRLDLVQKRLAMTKSENDLLTKNGFVVLERGAQSTYAWALHDVYQSQLPIWISADAILHAVYSSNDAIIAATELETLLPLLGRTLSAMHCALEGAAASYPPDVARDLDLYLTVARSLLVDAEVPSILGTDDEAKKLVASVKAASGIETIELYGRPHRIDWSAYEPRGHYAKAEATNDGYPRDAGGDLGPYFRAAMWLSRVEWNLVSRSSRSSHPPPAPEPSETPREAIGALALSDLVERANVLPAVEELDRTWGVLAGKREDVSVTNMIALRKKAGIAKIDLDAFEPLKKAIGKDFQRTARIHPMPEGSTELPAIMTFLGPRIVADSAAFRSLTHSETPGRHMLSAGDVAYVLGLDRGAQYLQDDLVKFPSLKANLDGARATLKSTADAGDLYSAWLGAIRGASEKPSGTLPAFMDTTAYDDLRLSTLVAGYGQIRHNYVLMAGQPYDEGGCVIPDGYVEPLPAVYEGIVKYARRGKQVMKQHAAYFEELEKVASVLLTIARHEVEGKALTEEEKRWLSMVVEMTPGSTGGPPTYTGWYFDLFRGRETEALASVDFVADYYTSGWEKKVAYAGVSEVRTGVFVVDAGGAPRVMVGPVARSYEMEGTLDKRFNDATAKAAPGKRDPWAASYTAAAPKVPAFALRAMALEGSPGEIVIKGGPTEIKDMKIDLLDHHRVTVQTFVRTVPVSGTVKIPLKRTASALRVRIGDFSAESAFGLVGGGLQIERGGTTFGDSTE